MTSGLASRFEKVAHKDEKILGLSVSSLKPTHRKKGVRVFHEKIRQTQIEDLIILRRRVKEYELFKIKGLKYDSRGKVAECQVKLL